VPPFLPGGRPFVKRFLFAVFPAVRKKCALPKPFEPMIIIDFSRLSGMPV
jgi:hypothetical protein